MASGTCEVLHPPFPGRLEWNIGCAEGATWEKLEGLLYSQRELFHQQQQLHSQTAGVLQADSGQPYFAECT